MDISRKRAIQTILSGDLSVQQQLNRMYELLVKETVMDLLNGTEDFEAVKGSISVYETIPKLWRRAAETVVMDKKLTMIDSEDNADKIDEPVFRYMSEECITHYGSLVRANRERGEMSREQLKHLLNMAYSPTMTGPRRLFEARVGGPAIKSIERGLAFFGRDDRSVQSDVADVKLLTQELVSRGFEVEETDVETITDSDGDWALKCTKDGRTSKLEYSVMDLIIDGVVINATFITSRKNLEDLEHYIDGMCKGNDEPESEPEEGECVDPDQDSDEE